MNKDIIITSNVSAGTQSVEEYPAAIPSGKIWVIKKFGACDINLGDNMSSVYILRFGTDIIRILSLTGATEEIEVREEVTGDGTKKLNVVRQNKSGFTKELPFWISAYERA